MTSIFNIERRRGDTRRHTFQIKNGGQPVDISSWSNFRMVVDPSSGPSGADNNVDSISGVLLTDGTDGRVFFVPSESVAPGRYHYDASATDSNSEVITFAAGRYEVIQDIAK